MDQRGMTELLCGCLAQRGEAGVAPAPAVPPPADRDRFLDLAEWHNIAPLLAHRLIDSGGGLQVPGNLLQRLADIRKFGAARNLCIYRDLSRLLEALRDDSIPVIVLKGAHLAVLVYEFPELRQMGDLDLLVPRDALGRAAKIVKGMGYIPLKGKPPDETGAVLQHITPLTRSGTVPVELHWGIEKPGHPFSIDLDGLWERAVPAQIAGVDVAVLCPGDLLLHICLHASYHHRFDISLQAFCDVAEIISRQSGDGLDWPAVEARIGEWGAARPVHLCLSLARELLRAEVPGELLRRLEPQGFNREVLDAARDKVFTGERAGVPRISGNVARLWGFDRSGGRLQYLRQRLFLSREEMARIYPPPADSWRIGLYYPVRLKSLLLMHGRAAWRLFRGDRELHETAGRENILTEYLQRF